jgi:superfamily II DNA or RNA helicase
MGAPEILTALKIVGRKIRVLFVAHKHRLLSQAEQTFAADSNVELIPQSMFTDISPELVKAGWDVCVLDEAHHEACSSFQYQLEKLGDFPIVGLTATPDRADGCLIKFDNIINPITREQAVAEGYLAPTNIHTFVDVPSKDKLEVLTDIFSNYAGQMGQTMVFVKTKKEVSAITLVLQTLGYIAVGVTDQSEKELNNTLEEFSEGAVQFIVNCNKINEGVDVKGCTDVVLGRQFGSYPQLNQVIGRAARPDSDCNVWELINPLSGRNLDTTVVVGTPEFHRLVNKEGGAWVERQFDYITHRTNKQLGIASGIRIRH